MTLLSAIALFATGFFAGVVNPVAGGGTFLVFPALLLSGLDPRAANMTVSVALLPMQMSTGWAGRKMAGDAPELSFKALLVTSFIGGAAGAILLLITPGAFFAKLVPWLILFATLLFAYGSYLKKPEEEAGLANRLGRNGMLFCQIVISIYGGYFGAGIGILMLAMLTLAGMGIRKAGTTKNILTFVINSMSVVFFVFSKDVGWSHAALVGAGALLGGLIGFNALKFVNERILRAFVIFLGLTLTLVLFIY